MLDLILLVLDIFLLLVNDLLELSDPRVKSPGLQLVIGLQLLHA